MGKKNNIPQVEAPVVEKPEDKIPATATTKSCMHLSFSTARMRSSRMAVQQTHMQA